MAVSDYEIKRRDLVVDANTDVLEGLIGIRGFTDLKFAEEFTQGKFRT